MTLLDASLDPSPLICPRCRDEMGSPLCCGLPAAHLPDVHVDRAGRLRIHGEVVCPANDCLEPARWCPGGPDHLVAEPATRLPREEVPPC